MTFKMATIQVQSGHMVVTRPSTGIPKLDLLQFRLVVLGWVGFVWLSLVGLVFLGLDVLGWFSLVVRG